MIKAQHKVSYFKHVCVLLTIAALNTVSVFAQQNRRETVADGLVGPVAKVNSVMYLARVANDEMFRGDALEHIETTYNSNGQRKSMSFLATEEDKVVFRTRYKHDAFGVTTLEQVVDNNEEVIGRTYYIYDPNFVMTESYVEDAERQVEHRTRYKYDGAGRLTQRSYNDATGQVYRREAYTYNDNGTILTCTIYSRQDKKIQEIRYEYDTHRQPTTKTIYDYSEEEPEVFVTLYCYRYDEQGNWIQRTEYSVEGGDRNPEYITERQIRYYEQR